MVIFESKRWWKDDIYWLLKSSGFEIFGLGKYGLFLSQKEDGKMIFTDYWKVLVLNFSKMGNTVFFWVKNLMEKLLITDYWNVLVLNFWEMGNTVFFLSKKSWWKDYIYWLYKSSCIEKVIFTDYWKVLILNFSEMGNTVSLWAKSWWKDNIYLVFWSFQ